MRADTRIFTDTVADRMGPPPPSVRVGTRLGEAVALMSERGGRPVLVTDAAGIAIGILTGQDLASRVAWRVSPEEPVETVMSAPVVSARAGETLHHAAARMRRTGRNALPVLDDDGRPAGVLGLAEAISAPGSPLLALVDLAGQDAGTAGLRRLKDAQVDLVAALLADGTTAPAIQALLSDLNDDLHRLGADHVVLAMERDGWGLPPRPYALVVMGSSGRRECLLAPDQDNGLVIADYPDADHARIDGYFLELATRLTRLLDEIGFDLCKGNVMATNPVWRKRVSEWRTQIDQWVKKRVPIHLLQADVLLDVRHVHGDAALSGAVREHMIAAASRAPGFVKALRSIESDHTVAVGWFGLKKEVDEEDREGVVNLKMRGTLPLVEGARLMALRLGAMETSTLARLDRLRAAGRLTADDHDYLVHAFDSIGRLLLAQQVADIRVGRKPTDYVPVEALARRERDTLYACLKAIDGWRSVTAEDLAM